MLECLIIGDSIGYGLSMARPDCVQMTVSGINSWNWYKDFGKRPAYDMAKYKVVVVSIGTNDHDGIDTEDNIATIRSRIIADKVVWLLPSQLKRRKQYQIVMDYCRQVGDICMDIDNFTGQDRIHPPTLKAYRELSNEINYRTK